MKQHHPSLQDLTDYATGALKLSHALCIAAHIEHCRDCKTQIKKLELVGASVFQHQKNTPMPKENLDALKNSVFEKLFSEQAPAKGMNSTTQRNQIGKVASNTTVDNISYRVPKSLGQFVKADFSELVWKRLSPSIKLATLCNDKDGSQVALSCVKAGGKMPHHSHTGKEITVVLEGSFSDEDGFYSKGDYVSRDAHDKHKPIVTNDGECICLMVLDSPIEFTGFFARLLNPVIRRHHYQ